MAKILTDLSVPALAHAVKQNYFDAIESMLDWDQADILTSPAVRRWWTPIPHPLFNGILSRMPPQGGQTPGADESALIGETIAYFHSRDRDTFTWWLAPELESSDWGRQLEAHGLKFDNDTPGMAVDLAALHEDIPAPEGLKIVRVEDVATMETWAGVFVPGYELPPEWEASARDMLLAVGVPPNCGGKRMPLVSYLAYVHDQPAAVSMVCYAAGVAGIYNVATLPDWRGKGLGAAVTLQPLLDARKLGYRVGILQASDMGYKVYQRLGFNEVCRHDHYYWRKEE